MSHRGEPFGTGAGESFVSPEGMTAPGVFTPKQLQLPGGHLCGLGGRGRPSQKQDGEGYALQVLPSLN